MNEHKTPCKALKLPHLSGMKQSLLMPALTGPKRSLIKVLLHTTYMYKKKQLSNYAD